MLGEPPFNVPVKDVVDWFERNGTLLSCDDILKETANDNDNHMSNAIGAAVHSNSEAAKISCQNPIRQTSTTYDIAISPHATLHIISLHHHGRPAFMLVTESQCPPQIGTQRQLLLPKKISYLMVSNCRGYWVSDCCGLGGFQQALFFPVHKQKDEDGSIINSLHGAILTDGVDLWLPSSLSDNYDCTSSVKIVKSTVSSWMYEGPCPELILPSICKSSPSINKRKADSAHGSNSNRPVRQKVVEKQDEEGNMGNRTASANSAFDWRTTIERALGERLKSLKQEEMEQVRREQIRDFVLLKSQMALQELMEKDDDWTNANDNDPKPKVPPVELTELRYRLHKRQGKQIGSSSSGTVVLALEADILCVDEQTKTDADKGIALRNAYLSCTPGNIQNNDKHKVECQSGVIPLLHFGDHITVSVHLKLDNRDLPQQCSPPSGKDSLDLTIQILGSHPEDDMPMCGLYLASVRIPLSSIMEAPTSQEWSRCVNPSGRRNSRPCIAYDCQPPDPT